MKEFFISDFFSANIELHIAKIMMYCQTCFAQLAFERITEVRLHTSTAKYLQNRIRYLWSNLKLLAEILSSSIAHVFLESRIRDALLSVLLLKILSIGQTVVNSRNLGRL